MRYSAYHMVKALLEVWSTLKLCICVTVNPLKRGCWSPVICDFKVNLPL